MRTYGSVHTCFWENHTNQQLSDQAKLLALYLLTGPHSNMLGCFRLPEGYVTEDLKWDTSKVKAAFNELSNISFLTRDTQSSWVVIHDFLKSNPIQNPKQGVGVEKIFNTIPENAAVLKPLIKSLLVYGKYLQKEFLNRLYTPNDQYETLFLDSSTDQEQNQNQNQDQNQEQEYMSDKSDVFPLKDFSFEKHKSSEAKLKSEALEVLGFLNEKTGRAYRPVDSNLKLIMVRLRTGVTVMDCRQIIAKKTREWKGNPKMSEYLRPETLFNASKFEQYIGELVEPQEDENDNDI